MKASACAEADGDEHIPNSAFAIPSIPKTAHRLQDSQPESAQGEPSPPLPASSLSVFLRFLASTASGRSISVRSMDNVADLESPVGVAFQ